MQIKLAKLSAESKGIVRNGMWAASQQTLGMVLNAVIGILLVLAVPVHEYGIYSYAVALCAIGSSVMSAGLSGLAVRELVNRRDENAIIVGGLTVIREAFALIGYIVIGLLSLTAGDGLATAATLLACVALFGRALDAPESWYLSHLRSRRTASIRMSTTAVLFVVRLGLLLLWPNIWLLLSLFAAESLIAGGAILYRYLKDPEAPGINRAGLAQTLPLLKQSWPLLLSGMANQINLKSDVVVIQAMLGSVALGVYSAAARLSELAYFLPVVFMNSTLPVLLKVRKEEGPESARYKNMLQRSYDQAFWAGLLVAGVVAGVGSLVITHIFGDEYGPAVDVLVIHVMACPFVFMAAVYSKWIISEGYFWSSVVRHSLGAVTNIALNLVLLPTMGVRGAAIATVASYIMATYIAAFVGKRSRPAGRQMTLAIVAPVRYGARYLAGRRNPRQTTEDPQNANETMVNT